MQWLQHPCKWQPAKTPSLQLSRAWSQNQFLPHHMWGRFPHPQFLRFLKNKIIRHSFLWHPCENIIACSVQYSFDPDDRVPCKCFMDQVEIGTAPPTVASYLKNKSLSSASSFNSLKCSASGPLLEVTTCFPDPNAVRILLSPGSPLLIFVGVVSTTISCSTFFMIWSAFSEETATEPFCFFSKALFQYQYHRYLFHRLLSRISDNAKVDTLIYQVFLLW